MRRQVHRFHLLLDHLPEPDQAADAADLDLNAEGTPPGFVRFRLDDCDGAALVSPSQVVLLQEGGQAVSQELLRLLLVAVREVDLVTNCPILVVDLLHAPARRLQLGHLDLQLPELLDEPATTLVDMARGPSLHFS